MRTILRVMVVECISTTALRRYLQEESGAGKLESLRSRSRLSLFQADVHEEEGNAGLLYVVCGGDGSVEGCISGRKRQGREEKEGEL